MKKRGSYGRCSRHKAIVPLRWVLYLYSGLVRLERVKRGNYRKSVTGQGVPEGSMLWPCLSGIGRLSAEVAPAGTGRSNAQLAGFEPELQFSGGVGRTRRTN